MIEAQHPLLPLVSILLPIRNEERYLQETLESLTGQNYPNLELIVSDNASTDGTDQVCLQYQKKFTWIRYLRQERNIGLGANFRTVRDLARGDFILFACGHDLWSPNYVSACVETLQLHPDAAIAVPATRWIGPDGEPMDKHSGYSDTRGMDVVARYFTAFWGNMHPTYGLIRQSMFKDWPIRLIVGEDLILLTHLAMRGDFVHVPNILWSRREFRFEKSYDERIKRYKGSEQMVARSPLDRLLPFVRLITALFSEVFTSPISMSNKLLVTTLLPFSIIARFFSGRNQYKQ